MQEEMMSLNLEFTESLLDILYRVVYSDNVKLTFHHRFRIGCALSSHKMRNQEELPLKNRLEEIRKDRGVTQEELAASLEVSRQTIGSLENGRYNPSILLAFKIARYFQMSIEDIFIYEEEE